MTQSPSKSGGTGPAHSGPGAPRHEAPPAAPGPVCFHCGTACRGTPFHRDDKAFCCQGCLVVFELLTDHGLAEFYRLGENAGVRVRASGREDQFRFLDDPAVRRRLADYSDELETRVTFRVPAIHCIACVWLLENLFRLKPGIGPSRVNFLRKEVAVTFQNEHVSLGAVAALLASLGYEPEFNLADLENPPRSPASRRLWLQLGIAGFAFGNIMLFSIPSYLGLDHFSGPGFKSLFGYLSLVLALPVFVYSAADYWRSAWIGIRHRTITLDVPIAAGLLALYAQSLFEILTGRGEGYLDSLAGLIFFLLCGKWFQQKTFDRLAFDRDYKSFFPLSVARRTAPERRPPARRDSPGPAAMAAPADGTSPQFAPRRGTDPQASAEERVALSQLQVGDIVILRNGELLPADAVLLDGPALIDYSFVTGESDPVAKKPGDHLYAGGRHLGATIQARTVKPVSQSYLTSLWNQDAFRKGRTGAFDSLTNRYSRRFTVLVVAVAVSAAVFWSVRDPARALKAFTSVLIVACPCALALAAPFTLGTAQRALGRRNVFLKSPSVIESLARADAVVFDKTGTLTAAGAGSVTFLGPPLDRPEQAALHALTRHSTHPCSVRIADALAGSQPPEPVRSFREIAGCGVEGCVAGHEIRVGSGSWLASLGLSIPPTPIAAAALAGPGDASPDRCDREPAAAETGSTVHIAVDGRYRGCFLLAGRPRPDTGRLIRSLSARYHLALLSGDNDRDRESFSRWFGRSQPVHFNQSPLHKLEFIRRLQQSGRTVVMVGDGLNDAGALRQSDVGVAVVENVNAFSPASDVILSAAMVPRLDDILSFSRASVRVVGLSFVISSLYNVVGISIAARGLLSPLICAILMPLSSITVVSFACGATRWLAGRRVPVAKPAGRTRPTGPETAAPAPAQRRAIVHASRERRTTASFARAGAGSTPAAIPGVPEKVLP